MKITKFLILALLCMVFHNYASAHANNSNGIDFAQATADDLAGPGVGVGVKIKWGRKKHNCTGIGVCDVEFVTEIKYDIELTGGPQPSGGGLATLTIVDGQLQMDVPKSSLTEDTAENHFSGGEFEVQESFSLPADVVNELGEDYTIQVGQYPIEETEDTYTITF